MGPMGSVAWERAMKVQEVILRAMAKKITWWQAAEIIGISERQMRRWHRRYEKFGYDGLWDRRRGGPSPRRVPLQTAQQVLRLYGEQPGNTLWDRFTVHYTPKHGSWLNQAEIEIGLFSRQCLGQRRIPDLPTLRSESRAWNRRINHAGVTINWKFDRKAARKKFGYTTNSFTRSKN